MGKKKPPKKSPAKKKKKKTGSPIRSNLAKSVDPASPSGNLPPATVDDESHCDSATLDPPADGSSPSPSLVSEQKALAPVKVVNTTVPEPKTLTDTASVKVVETTVPEPSNEDNVATVKVVNTTVPEPTSNTTNSESPAPSHDTWSDKAKGTGKKLKKKGSPYTLPSGEVCIDIPNSVIEKNKKSWDCFILGQFYHDPPSKGTIYKIVNGIWSKTYRDITVSKMEGFVFLFRIPNASTRHHVLKQRLWQIEGQTMFVDKWEPGVIPTKPELSSAPIWLELRNVPLQFFNEDGLERIAGLVGDPKDLHSNTANKMVLDVAKVFTVIDPRKPLPEAVNVRFDSGDIARVLVSSPWMPPICQHCNEIGHTSKRCKSALVTCTICNSSTHDTSKCTRLKKTEESRQPSRRHKSNPPTQEWQVRKNPLPAHTPNGAAQLLLGEGSDLTPNEKA